LLVILSKGTMDMVCPALMITTTGATMGKEVHMFFTFWGLDAVYTIGDATDIPV
jgi:peroxiredoxin family protein